LPDRRNRGKSGNRACKFCEDRQQPFAESAASSPRVQRGHSNGITLKEHIILGTDERDVEEQRDLWLAKNPTIKVLRVQRPKREPPKLADAPWK
jgi:hypothetical protein